MTAKDIGNYMTLNDVVSNWNTIDIPAGVRAVAAPIRNTSQPETSNDPANAWRRFAKAVRDWLSQATTHVCVVCGQEVVQERCHAFPRAGLERVRDFNANQAEDHIVGHTFEGLLKARVYGMGGATSHQQFACDERTVRNIEDLVKPDAPEALRCRVGGTCVAPLLCKDHEMRFSEWESSSYIGTKDHFWTALPAGAMFCLAYRVALRQTVPPAQPRTATRRTSRRRPNGASKEDHRGSPRSTQDVHRGDERPDAASQRPALR